MVIIGTGSYTRRSIEQHGDGAAAKRAGRGGTRTLVLGVTALLVNAEPGRTATPPDPGGTWPS